MDRKGPCQRKARGPESGGSNSSADGGRGPEPRNAGLQKLEMARKWVFL